MAKKKIKAKRGKSNLTKLNPNRQVTMTYRELQKIQRDATIQAVRIGQLFPLMILRDKYGFAHKRLPEFQQHYHEMWDAYNKGYVDLEDMARTLQDEAGVLVGAVNDIGEV